MLISVFKTYHAKLKRGRKKTGGGKAVRDLSPFSQRVISLLPVQMNSLDNDYDEDASDEELVIALSDNNNNKKEVESEKKPILKPTGKSRQFRLINKMTG